MRSTEIKPQMNMNDEECDYETKRKQWRRGETPEDIQTECRNLCSQYLGGIWSEISENQLNIRRITGGFTNQIYYCGLSSQCATIGNEPQEVAVKCYGKKWISNYTENDRFNDIVINLLAAKHNLGPKQYAFFSRGNIEEYIKSHSFGLKEKSDGKYVDKLSRMLATFHSMDVPIARNENWFSKFLDDFYTKAYELFPLTEMFREVNATTLLNTNLKDEINWLKKCLKATNSPLVFSHNDFRGPNIMVREIDQNNDQSIAIAFCDFEYSCYAYRGFDFGAIFEDWGRTDAQEVCGRVSDFEIEQFMIGYLDENIKIHGNQYRDNSVNTIKHLVIEAKVFLLFQQMFFIMFGLRTEEMPYNNTKLQLLQRADQRLRHYLHLKSKYIAEGLICSALD